LEERNLAQVTINLMDYTKTSMYSVFEMVKMEARRYGVQVVGSEVVGILPMQALVDCAEYYLQIEDFSVEQVLEYHI
ncbi:MAG: glutamate formiminotransferase, partial [Oscillospiraceae bacterium]